MELCEPKMALQALDAVMKRYIVWIGVLLGLFQLPLMAQNKDQLIREADSLYKANIVKTRINGVYIPKDLEEAFTELDRLSPPDALLKIKVEEETFIARKLHFGLGRWMAINWNFDEGSRFSHFLTKLGLLYRDEMIDFMLISYHRYLNQRPQEVETRVKQYVEKRKKKQEKEK